MCGNVKGYVCVWLCVCDRERETEQLPFSDMNTGTLDVCDHSRNWPKCCIRQTCDCETDLQRVQNRCNIW